MSLEKKRVFAADILRKRAELDAQAATERAEAEAVADAYKQEVFANNTAKIESRPAEPTLQDLKNDKDFNELLGSRLARVPGLDEAATRWMENTATKEDIDLIADVRRIRIEREAKRLELQRDMDAHFNTIRASSKNIDQLCMLHGVDAVKKTIEFAFKKASTRDESDPLFVSFENVGVALGEAKTLDNALHDPESVPNQKISSFLESHPNIDQNELEKLLAIRDGEERRHEIRMMIRGQMNTFGRGVDWLRLKFGGKKSSDARAENLSRTMQEIEEAQALADQSLGSFGKLLSSLVTKNHDIFVTLQQAASGADIEAVRAKEPVATYRDMKGKSMEKSITETTVESARAAFDLWLAGGDESKAESARIRFERQNKELREETVRQYQDSQAEQLANEKLAGKSGFWKSVLKALFLSGMKKRTDIHDTLIERRKQERKEKKEKKETGAADAAEKKPAVEEVSVPGDAPAGESAPQEKLNDYSI